MAPIGARFAWEIACLGVFTERLGLGLRRKKKRTELTSRAAQDVAALAAGMAL